MAKKTLNSMATPQQEQIEELRARIEELES
jgi:hypothetical protein